MTLINDLNIFYSYLADLEERIGGKKELSECHGKLNWPNRGVYFFFEKGETRENGDMRVVRVGTHALKKGSKTTLWNRLRQHRGNLNGNHPGGGNHRGSIFRLHVGTAIISKENIDIPTWSKGSTANSEIRSKEYELEYKVSNHICSMPFIWLKIDDDSGPESDRGFIERNSISLLSNYRKDNKIDIANPNWLGRSAWNEKVKLSGLWNVKHVDENYNPKFLDLFKRYIEGM